MGTQWAGGGYSTDVEIYLCAEGERLRVAQVGPDRLILRDRRDIGPGRAAEIVISVDGVEESHSVILEGCARESDIVMFREAEANVPF